VSASGHGRPPRRGVGAALGIGLLAGVGAALLGLLVVTGWLVAVTDGPLSTLAPVTQITGGKPVPSHYVPVWAFGGAMGLPVRLVETTGAGTSWVHHDLVDAVGDSGDGRWLGLLAPTVLALAGALAARLTGRVRSGFDGFAAGAAVAAGFVPAVVAGVLVARVGLGDAPTNAEGYVVVGSTWFRPADLAGDAVGLARWRSALVALLAAVGFGGLGGAVVAWRRG
jgi:hypothetical protein